MTSKLVLASFATAIPLSGALLVAPVSEPRARSTVAVRPLSESEHALFVAELFGGDSAVPHGETHERGRADPRSASASITSTSPGSPPVPHSPGSAPDPSWRRIDTFGIRETWGYTRPNQPDTSPLAFAFATVFVPGAYQHCHYFYELVTDMEVRIVPVDGGPTTVLRAQLQPGESAVSIVVPASLWRNASRGRVLAWPSWANPAIDAEAISDQEFSP